MAAGRETMRRRAEWDAFCKFVITNDGKRFVDPDGMKSENFDAYSSVIVDNNGKVNQVNDDGDPGVYMVDKGKKTLVGYMNPLHKYKLGESYEYYGKDD